MAVTHTLIQTITVGSGGAANIEFTSIPATYTDLKLVFSARSVEAYNYAAYQIKFNGSATGFTARELYGSSNSAASTTRTNTFYSMDGATATANTFSNTEIYIPNYASANNKSFSLDGVSEDNTVVCFLALDAGLWSNTAAITSISIVPVTTVTQYSSASLYGIKNS
jgi:hypothetical protein